MPEMDYSGFLDYQGLRKYNDYIQSFVASYATNSTGPIGTIVSYLGTVAPHGWLVCDGKEYKTEDYPKLAEFIEIQFGSVNYFGGDGETTFAVPDLRDRFILGAGETRTVGENGGSDSIVLSADTLPAHSHNITGIGIEESDKGGSLFSGGDDAIGASAEAETGETGNGQPISILPPYCVLSYIVKAQEIERKGSSMEDYSTEEIRIGTWSDGRPLYRKVIPGTMPANATNSWVTVATCPSNLGSIARLEAIVYGEEWTAQLPYLTPSGSNIGLAIYKGSAIRVACNNSLFSSGQLYVILEYTKTTDPETIQLDTPSFQNLFDMESIPNMPVTAGDLYDEEM